MENQSDITQSTTNNPTQSTSPETNTNFLQKMPRKIWIIGGVVLVVIFLLFLFLSMKSSFKKTSETQPASISKPGQMPILTGLEIAKKTALFLDKSASSSGEFKLQYACDKQMKTGCVAQTHEGPTGQIILAYLKLYEKTKDPTYKQKADKAMKFYLSGCLQNSRICQRNITALVEYYENTKDERYKTAILSTEESILQEKPLSFHIQNNDGDKLAIMYKVSGDKKYQEKLAQLADRFLAGEYDSDKDNPEIYKNGTYSVRQAEPVISAYFYLPAYEATKDVKYLQAAKTFFDNSRIDKHIDDMKKLGNSLPLIISMDALVELSEVTQNNSYLMQTQTIAEFMAKDLWDSKEKKKFSGSYNFLHAFGDQTNAVFTVNNGWLILIYLKLEGEKFNLS